MLQLMREITTQHSSKATGDNANSWWSDGRLTRPEWQRKAYTKLEKLALADWCCNIASSYECRIDGAAEVNSTMRITLRLRTLDQDLEIYIWVGINSSFKC